MKRTEDDENHNNTEMECGYVPATYLAPKGFHVDHADSQGSIDDIELDWDNDEYPPNVSITYKSVKQEYLVKIWAKYVFRKTNIDLAMKMHLLKTKWRPRRGT